jgi:arylsulfatase A
MKNSKESSKMQTLLVPSRGSRFSTALVLILLAAGVVGAAEDARFPNVVMLLADDLGYKDIGCDGGPVKTPVLDGLAANGVRFTDFYSAAPVCSPARASLLTGRQHIRAGIYGVLVFSDARMHLLEREVTLAELLKEHGYSTGHFGKWHLGSPNKLQKDKPSPLEHGFDYWFGMESGASPSHKNPTNFLRNGQAVGPIEGYSAQIVVDDAISWLDRKRDPDTPFFLNVWFHEPHDPIAAPDDVVSEYGELDDQAAIYSGTIDNTDRAIARLLEKLKEVDAPENTLIIYSSDNGSYRADRVGNLRGVKGSNYEGGIRVPGIVSWPGTVAKGRIEREPAGLVDVLPTVCGLLGIDRPKGVHLDGSDISPLLTKRAGEFTRHQPLFWHMPTSNPALAIRDGNYSMLAYRDYELPRDNEAIAQAVRDIEEYMRNTENPELPGKIVQRELWKRQFMDPEAERLRWKFLRLGIFQESAIPAIKAGGYERFELYDLSTDPGQQTDLSAKLPEVAARLEKKMLEINASVLADGPDWK